MSQFATIAVPLARGSQRYLLQALSFAVHIPPVRFGIAFPALLLYVESV
jgi:hypothetical protein